jgi:hypothetical protein
MGPMAIGKPDGGEQRSASNGGSRVATDLRIHLAGTDFIGSVDRSSAWSSAATRRGCLLNSLCAPGSRPAATAHLASGTDGGGPVGQWVVWHWSAAIRK